METALLNSHATWLSPTTFLAGDTDFSMTAELASGVQADFADVGVWSTTGFQPDRIISFDGVATETALVVRMYLQSDPIGQSGTVNLYGYAENNPVTYIDPEGLRTECSDAATGARVSCGPTPIPGPPTPERVEECESACREKYVTQCRFPDVRRMRVRFRNTPVNCERMLDACKERCKIDPETTRKVLACQ